MATIYRRERGWGYRRWHFCQNCRYWPQKNFEEVRWAPQGYDKCPSCARLSERGHCAAGTSWF